MPEWLVCLDQKEKGKKRECDSKVKQNDLIK